MAIAEPLQRVRFAEKEVHSYQDEVESRKGKHAGSKDDCRLWEDPIAKANFVFGRIMALDADIQESVFAGRIEFSEELSKVVRGILQTWLTVSTKVLAQISQVELTHAKCEGSDEFRQHVKEAKGILTPDDEFFRGDKLSDLRDQAIDAHRSGETEPLLQE